MAATTQVQILVRTFFENRRRRQFFISKSLTLALPFKQWNRRGSNPGPSACEADVIPLHHVPDDANALVNVLSRVSGKLRSKLAAFSGVWVFFCRLCVFGCVFVRLAALGCVWLRLAAFGCL